MMNKRGMSAIVITVIMIVLVLVAIGVVWIVVQNLISDNLEQISLGKLTINLDIESVKVNENSIDVKVKRNPGQGELSGINFIVGDGIDTQIFEESTTMQEL